MTSPVDALPTKILCLALRATLRAESKTRLDSFLKLDSALFVIDFDVFSPPDQFRAINRMDVSLNKSLNTELAKTWYGKYYPFELDIDL